MKLFKGFVLAILLKRQDLTCLLKAFHHMTEDTDSDNQITSLSIVSHPLLSHATYRLLLHTAILTRVILQKPWLGMASNSLTLPGWGSLCFCKKKGESTMHVLKLFCSIILKHLDLQSSNHEPPLTIIFFGIDMYAPCRATFLEIVSHQCSSNDLPNYADFRIKFSHPL